MQYITKGFARMWANKRLVLVFYLANLIIGLLAIWPFNKLVGNFVGNSMIGQLPNSLENFYFISDLTRLNGPGMGTAINMILVMAVIYLLLSLFFSGGLYASLVSGESYQPARFWGGCGQYFARFIRALLWSLPLILLMVGVFLLLQIVLKAYYDDDIPEAVIYYGVFTRIGLFMIMFFFYKRVLDYARIYIVVEDIRATRKAVWRAFKLVLGKLPRVTFLAGVFAILGLVALYIHVMIRQSVESYGPMGTVWMVFLLGQIYLFFKMSLRVAHQGGQLDLYLDLYPLPEPVVEEPPPEEPATEIEETESESGEPVKALQEPTPAEPESEIETAEEAPLEPVETPEDLKETKPKES
jgi:hypothetical protein